MPILRSIAYIAIAAIGLIALFAYETGVPQEASPANATHETVGYAPPEKEIPYLSFPEAADAPKPKPRVSITLKDALPVAPQEEAPVKRNETSAQNAAKNDAGTQVTRIQNPYPFPPLTDEELNSATRAALVNIFCTLQNGQSVSGSGVLIDERGIILTNAHIAQYVLLSEASPNIACLGRTDAPARSSWKLRVVFIPSAWIDTHAKDIRTARPTGTGEHDYALLLTLPLQGTAAPKTAPVAYDTREAVAFETDYVMLASYPAGFIGSFTVQNHLYPATTFTTVRELFTFKESTIDLMSLGGVIVAQGGSSGGAVVNRWGRLVGLIVTTSDGETTAERDLRAITLAHVDRSIREHAGIGLGDYLGVDLEAHASNFRINELPALAQKLVDQLP